MILQCNPKALVNVTHYPNSTGRGGKDVTWGDLESTQTSQTIQRGAGDTNRLAVL